MVRPFYVVAITFLCLGLAPLLSEAQGYDDVELMGFSKTESKCFPITLPGATAGKFRFQPLSDLVIPDGIIQIGGTFSEANIQGSSVRFHLHTIRFLAKYISASGRVLATTTYDLAVNSDGKIPVKKFPLPPLTVKAKEKLEFSIIPVEGFLAPRNILKLNMKYTPNK